METITEFRGEHRWLSNFWLCKLTLDGIEYPSAEHAYQAAKAATQQDAQWVRLARTPGEAKRRGRVVAMRPDWDPLGTMERVLRAKFEDVYLQEKLIATGDVPLIEGNTWRDTFWGVDRTLGGENHLGKLLMKIRKELQERRTGCSRS